MFAQPYGALPPVPTASPGDDDDIWHVAISWDDVKVMSVEQLDDAFRLDIINSETPVWQVGMSGWQPLGVVAGIGGDADDDDDEDSQEDVLTDAELEVVWPPFPAPIKPSAVRSARPTPAPPRPPSRAPAPPTPIAAPSRVPTSTGWPSFAPAVAPPPARMAPVAIAPVIPLAPRPVATASLAPPAGFGAPSALYQAANANAAPRHPPTVPPVAMSVTMPPPRHRGSSGAARFGQWLLALAFVGGLATTLYRNDVLLQAAQKNGFEKQYLSVERAVVGSPGFGTLRSLAALVSGESSKLGSSAAAIGVTETPSTTPATDDDKADTKTEAAPEAEETKPSSTTKAESAVDISSLKVETGSKAKEEAAPKAQPKEAEPKPAARETARSAPAPKSEKRSKAEERAAAKAEARAAAAAKAEAKAAAAAEARAAKAKAKEKAAGKGKSDERAAALALIEKARAARGIKAEAPKAEKPEPKEAPKRAAPPPREEAAAAPPKPKTQKSLLDAAISDSIEKSNSAPAKKKKKAGPNADYDPMNGDL